MLKIQGYLDLLVHYLKFINNYSIIIVWEIFFLQAPDNMGSSLESLALHSYINYCLNLLYSIKILSQFLAWQWACHCMIHLVIQNYIQDKINDHLMNVHPNIVTKEKFYFRRDRQKIELDKLRVSLIKQMHGGKYR